MRLLTSSIAIIAVSLAACQTATRPSVYCDIARPITYSATQDTPETVRQIQEANAVYNELCG